MEEMKGDCRGRKRAEGRGGREAEGIEIESKQ